GSIVLQIATYAVAGAIIAVTGYRDAFLINGFIYALVVVVIIFIKTDEKLPREAEGSLSRFGTDFIEGMKFLFHNQEVMFVVSRVFLLMTALGFVYVALTGSFLQTILNETGITKMKEIKALGFVQAFMGLGLVFGVILLKPALKWFKEQSLIRSLYPLLGLLVGTIYFCKDYYYLLVVALIGGMAGIMVLSIAETEVQKHTPPAMRGRIFSAYYILRSAGLGIAMSLTGKLVTWAREDMIILAAGSVLFAYGFITLLMQLITHKAK
ncbi:MAG: MFS transporter, partial [Spirochaetia bacterium]|nr:MFS transporter [Spirochaetia bacterium]